MTRHDKRGRPKKANPMRALTPKQCQSIIKSHQKAMTSIAKSWDRRRRWYQSRWAGGQEETPTGSGPSSDFDELGFETNSAYAFVDSMCASVVPLNPQVTVNPRRPDLSQFSLAREALANDRLHRLKIHEKLWVCASNAAMFDRGFLKLQWNPKKNKCRFRAVDPRFVFFDQGADDWESIRYIIEVTVITREKFEYRVGAGIYDPKVAEKAKFGGYPGWLKDKQKDGTHIKDVAREVFEWVTVYEFYDFTSENGSLHQFLDDQEEPLYSGELPYRMLRNPFQMLTFNDNLEDLGGMSDIQLIESALDQLNELDVLQLTFAKSSLPTAFIHTGLASDPKAVIEGYRDSSGAGAFVEVRADPSVGIENIITFSRPPGLVPEHQYMRAQAMETINFVLGLPEYSRGKIGGSDIATEVALADSATRTRNGRREKRMHNLVSWAAEGVVNLYEEFYPDTDILYVRLTGDEDMLGITRETAGFRNMKEALEEAPLEYDFEVVPYSPTENSRLIQMKNLTQSWGLIEYGLNSGFLDEQKLMRHIAHVLQLPGNVLLTKEEISQKQALLAEQNAAVAGPAGVGLPPLAGEGDTLATGAVLGAELEPSDMVNTPMGGPGDGGMAPTPILRGTQGFPEAK